MNSPPRYLRPVSNHMFRYVALCVLFLALLGNVAHAQQAQPNSYAGFEGQRVAEVEIAARADLDTSDLRRRIEIAVGRPFSTEAIRASVATLRQAGGVMQVQVSLEPVQDGLRVLFILQPADYVGIIQFDGVGIQAPYTALLQAVNIPEQSPYVPELESQGQKGLLAYFRARGFFQAEITPEIRRDEPHHIVNLIFHCTLNRQAKVGTINFEGLSQDQGDVVRKSLHGLLAKIKRVTLKPGQKYSEPRIARSIPFIRDRLRKQNQLAPAIRISAPRYDPETNVADVQFVLTPGLKVSVQLMGAKASRKTIQKLVPIYEEDAVDQDLISEGQTNLKAYFQSKGYFDVTIDAHTDRQNDVVKVVYNVDLGSKRRLKNVYFDGNEHLSDRQLKALVSVKKGFLFTRGKYNEQLLKKSENAVTQRYKDDGYQSVSVQGKVEDFDPEVDVTLEIREGPQDHVASLHISGNKTQTIDQLTRKFPIHLRPGQVFSQKLLETDRAQLLAAYLDLGYLNAAVRSAAIPSAGDAHKMDVTYTIEEGPQARISEVVLLGEQHTKPRFIQEVVGKRITPQQPQSEGNFLQAESDLYDLGVFDWASVKPLRPIADQKEEETLIKVHESPLNSMDIGGGIEIIPRSGNIPVNSVVVPGLPPISLGNKFQASQESYVGPRFTFDFARHDLRGTAETATIGTILSRLDQRAFFTYAAPRLRGSAWSSLFSLSGERSTENPIFTSRIAQGSLQVEKSLDAKRTKRAIVRYSYQHTNLSNILIPGLVLPEDQDVRLSMIDAEYVRDDRDKPLDAHHGIYQTFDFGVTPKVFGSSADFVRFLGQTAFYKPLRPWLVWANNFRLGLAAPFAGSVVPLSERFFSGGADSLRGFPINGAGPQRPVPVCTNPANPASCSLISVPVGGNMLFIVNSEARFSLPFKSGLGAVLFYDGGNVYSNINWNQFADDFTHSVGIGIRYQTPVGPVRFDVGYRLTSVPGVRATQYFVTLGQSF